MNLEKDNKFQYMKKGNFIVGYTNFVWYKRWWVRKVLYWLTVWFYYILLYIASFLVPKFVNQKYKVAICAIFKNEGRFLKEWIDYHIIAGVEHFYLYNNNSDDNYLEVLEPYIKSGVIDLIDWPKNHAQMECYQHCYNNNRNDCEWLGFIDIDEFVCPINKNTIGEWLTKFSKKPGVAIYWRQFGSTGLLTHNSSKLVIEQYTQCWPKLSTYTKMFLNTRFEYCFSSQHHWLNSVIFKIQVPPINQFGKIIKYGINIGKEEVDIQINHYWGKSWDEFITKINMSAASKKTNEELKRMRIERLIPHEQMCTIKDFSIQRYILQTNLAWENKDQVLKDFD